MIYYPVPIHLQKAYEQYKFNTTQFVNANFVSQNIISLPMHTELSNDQLLYICETIKKFKP
jgi:dTDP-4-amino-4,6-dideoxygalactose transaminase